MDWVALRVAFGKVVRARRERMGVSQEAFAEIVGVHRTYMGAIERGERNISLRNLSRVAEAIGAPLSELFLDAERLTTSA